MIEHCTKKVMVLTVAGLILISVLVVFFEDILTPQTSLLGANPLFTHNSSKDGKERCIQSEKFSTLVKCQRCTEFEMRSQSGVCQPSGYKQHVLCEKTGPVWINCSKDAVEQRRHFYIFEGLVALVGIASYTLVFRRQSRLNHLLMEKVNRQIAAGV